MDVGWFWLRRCYIVVYFAHLDEIGRSRMIEAFIRAPTVIAVGAIPDFGQVGKVVLKKEKGPGCYLAMGGPRIVFTTGKLNGVFCQKASIVMCLGWGAILKSQ